jgi:cellulose biosynthesis protein BcsQ
MKSGQVVTFYSYKGGVGRTMALANIATILAQWGKKVLMIDWDLEAPGIEPYFSENTKSVSFVQKGIIDILIESNLSDRVSWQDFVQTINIKAGKEEIHFLNSGRNSKGYLDKIRKLDIGDFYKLKNGFRVIESLRAEWKSFYDFILIDSRTGITDNGGICTIQMPDILLLFFTTNDQSLEGTRDVVQRVNKGHQSQPFDRQNIMTIPIVSRFDTSTEFQISQEWVEKISTFLENVYNDWLPSTISKKEFIEKTKIPYIPYFSFGEKLSVIEQGINDPSGMGYAYESVASLIANNFELVEEFLQDRSKYIERIKKGLENNSEIVKDDFADQLLNSNSFSGLLNIYEEAKFKKKLTLGIYNVLIERSPDMIYALEFYNDMRDNNISPSEITFNILINKAPDFKYVMEFYNDMRHFNIRPNEITFNNLINKAPDFKYVTEFYNDMRFYDVRPNEITFNILINKAPDFKLAMEFYNDMRYFDIRPSEITFNYLINKAPDFKIGIELYNDMRRYDIRPGEITFNNLINKAPDLEVAKDLYKEMGYQDIKPSEITFNSLINKASDFKYAYEFYNEMRYQGIRPSAIVYNNLINKAPDYKYAIEFYNEMRYKGIRPSAITFNNLISKAPEVKFAMDFYNEMRNQKIRPNINTYLILVGVLDKFNDLEEAEQVLKEAINLDPNSIQLYLELAKIYKKVKDLGKALDIYHKVLELVPTNNVALNEIKKIKSMK